MPKANRRPIRAGARHAAGSGRLRRELFIGGDAAGSDDIFDPFEFASATPPRGKTQAAAKRVHFDLFGRNLEPAGGSSDRARGRSGCAPEELKAEGPAAPRVGRPEIAPMQVEKRTHAAAFDSSSSSSSSRVASSHSSPELLPNNDEDTPLLCAPLPSPAAPPAVTAFTAHYAEVFGVAGVLRDAVSVLFNDGSAVTWCGAAPGHDHAAQQVWYFNTARRGFVVDAVEDAAVPVPLAGKLTLARFFCKTLAQGGARVVTLPPSATTVEGGGGEAAADGAPYFITSYDAGRVVVTNRASLFPGNAYAPSSDEEDAAEDPEPQELLWEPLSPGSDSGGGDPPRVLSMHVLAADAGTGAPEGDDDVDALFSEAALPLH